MNISLALRTNLYYYGSSHRGGNLENKGIVAKLLVYMRQEKLTRAAAAKKWGVSVSMVDHVIRGIRQPSKQMLESVGYEKAPLTYRRKKKEKAE